jgi:hypothetical protein
MIVVERTRVTTSTPESPDVPARSGFTTYFALSPVTGLFCHRRQRIMVLSKPGRADLTSANLTPASGRQDHATSPYAATSLVGTLGDRSRVQENPPCDPIARKTLPRPPHPVPYVRDDRDTPLCVGRDAKSSRGDLGGMETEIFLQRGLDMPVNKLPDGQITPSSSSIAAPSRRLRIRSRMRARTSPMDVWFEMKEAANRGGLSVF